MNLITFFIVSVAMGVGALLAVRGNTGWGLSVWAGAVLVSQFLQMTASSRALDVLKALRPQGVDSLHEFSQRPVSGSLLAASEEQLQATPFQVTHAATLDGVPVNVNAVVRWHMPDAGRASMTLTDSRLAMSTVAHTLLGVAVRTSSFAALLADRDAVVEALWIEIADKTIGWGAIVRTVEVQGVALPMALEAGNDARVLLTIGLRLAQHRLRRAASSFGSRFTRTPRLQMSTPLPRTAPANRPASLPAP